MADGMTYIAPDEMIEGADIEGISDIDEEVDSDILDNSGEAFYNENYSALQRAREQKANELIESGVQPIDFNRC